jgi:hypothetical protein
MELIVRIQADTQADEMCDGEQSSPPSLEHVQLIQLPERPEKVL